MPEITGPEWLLAELTYACPLQCPYCSNPLNYEQVKNEMSTQDWIRVFTEARAMGAVQLGLSGGEPLTRPDLPELVSEARKLGYYTNLITSGHRLDEAKIVALKEAGLDHIQISFQASNEELNDYIAGTKTFEEKKRVARLIKKHDYPMVLCVVIHRQNIEQMEEILEMAIELKADYVEIANTQYHGWALLNRDQLLPSKQQLSQAEAIANRYREQLDGKMKIYFIVPDYYEGRPKACMNGWGTTFLTVTPDGMALPCHSARDLPGLEFPNVKNNSVSELWQNSSAFNFFRGEDWMKEPCKTCPDRKKDFGGCHCQAYMLTGDPSNADPACDLSPQHHVILDAINEASQQPEQHKPLVFRNSRNSKEFAISYDK